MKFLNIDINIKNLPELDSGFIPLGLFMESYLNGAKKPVSLALFRNRNLRSVCDTFIHDTTDMHEADLFYMERLCKTLLWSRGGMRLVVYGDDRVAAHLAQVYSCEGERTFDSAFMSSVYGENFSVEGRPLSEKPEPKEESCPVGGHWDGCRIGFDAGGSDRKVSAVIDGKVVYSEEVIWHPKTNENPDYHYAGIVEAMKTAASKMPRVDAIGVSSAGIYIDNQCKAASLFLKVPCELFSEKVEDIYIRAACELGDVPLMVANDGDVSALAGAMDFGCGNILGIAMGTSEAAGYIDHNMGISGWLNELAFVPLDCAPSAAIDEWSGDKGCGVKYFSQDGVIKLAAAAKIELNDADPPAQKLKEIQRLMEKSDDRAMAIYRSIGVYLGHSAPLYARFYELKHILLLGRVMSGKGGETIVNEAKRVLAEEYPETAQQVNLSLPDENSRRIGQSVAAASLPARATTGIGLQS